jgi:hypothetical protein
MHHNRTNYSGVMVAESSRWLLKISDFWTNKLTWLIWELSLIPSENWWNSKYQSGRGFPKLSNNWLNSIFRIKMGDLWLSEVEGIFRHDFRLSRVNGWHRVFLLVVAFRWDKDSQKSFLYAIWWYDANTTCGPIHPHRKKKVAKYIWVRVLGGKTRSTNVFYRINAS